MTPVEPQRKRKTETNVFLRQKVSVLTVTAVRLTEENFLLQNKPFSDVRNKYL